jgi:hypothetical protein
VPPLRDQRQDVTGKLGAGRQAAVDGLLSAGEVGEKVHDGLIPASEFLVVGLGQVQHLDDDPDREPIGELTHDVHLVAAPLVCGYLC